MSPLKDIPERYKSKLRHQLMPKIDPSQIQTITKNTPRSNKVLLLVEIRPQINIDLYVKQHMQFAPGWDSVVVTSSRNAHVQSVCDHVLIIPDNWANTYRRYQNLMCYPVIWKALLDLGYKTALCYQTDTRLLRTGVDLFTNWDWVGAPWPEETLKDSGGVGSNGGLSIRNIDYMHQVASQFKWAGEGEDMFFVKHMHGLGAKIAPTSVCEQFSCECFFKLGTLGCHAIQRYMTPTQIEQILTQYSKP